MNFSMFKYEEKCVCCHNSKSNFNYEDHLFNLLFAMVTKIMGVNSEILYLLSKMM